MDEREITRQACLDLGNEDGRIRERARNTLFSTPNLPIDVILERISVAEHKERRRLVRNFPALVRTNQDKNPEHMTFFFQHFLTEKDELIRRESMDCLLKLLSLCPVKELEDAILPYMLDEDRDVRRLTCQHVGTCRNAKAVPYLALLLDDIEVDIPVYAKKALQSIGTSAARYALEEWQKRNNSR